MVRSSSGVSAQRKTYAAMPAPPAMVRRTNPSRTARTEIPRCRATAALTPGVQPRERARTSGGRGARAAALPRPERRCPGGRAYPPASGPGVRAEPGGRAPVGRGLVGVGTPPS